MFGNKEKQVEHLIESRHWDKVDKLLERATPEVRLHAAQACGQVSDVESANLLIRLLKDEDERVQLAAVQSLGAVGGSGSATHLSWLLEHLPAGREQTREAISKALAAVHTRR